MISINIPALELLDSYTLARMAGLLNVMSQYAAAVEQGLDALAEKAKKAAEFAALVPVCTIQEYAK